MSNDRQTDPPADHCPICWTDGRNMPLHNGACPLHGMTFPLVGDQPTHNDDPWGTSRIASALPLLHELRTYLDTLTITGENIGEIRRACFVPWDSPWNGLVRDETATREGRGVSVAVPPAPAEGPFPLSEPRLSWEAAIARDRARREVPAPICGGSRLGGLGGRAAGCGTPLRYEHTANGVQHWRCPQCGNPHWWPDSPLERMRLLVTRLDIRYEFQCEAGPLRTCVEWQALKTELDALLKPGGAPVPPNPDPVLDPGGAPGPQARAGARHVSELTRADLVRGLAECITRVEDAERYGSRSYVSEVQGLLVAARAARVALDMPLQPPPASDATLRQLAGFLSADVPELNCVEVPRLAKSIERFITSLADTAHAAKDAI